MFLASFTEPFILSCLSILISLIRPKWGTLTSNLIYNSEERVRARAVMLVFENGQYIGLPLIEQTGK